MNRGLAILGDTLFMGTIDAHLIAIDAKNGHPLWNVTVGKAAAGYALTHAPLVVKDKVIVGTAGGEYGIRGFIAAYDVRTGKEAWRFYTIPGPGEPGHETWAGDSWKHGGGSVWVTGSYDPALNLTYWGIGNPGPDWNGDVRLGDNLYSDCVVALDADTGKLKWYYQFSPHDEFDYDSVQVPVLADMEWQGRAAQGHAVGQPQRLHLCARPHHRRIPAGQAFRQGELDERLRRKGPAHARARQAPHARGHADFSRQPGRHQLVFAFLQPAHRAVLHSHLGELLLGLHQGAGRIRRGPAVHGRFAPIDGRRISWRRSRTHAKKKKVTARCGPIDPKTGEKKWEFKMADVTDAGILTTASDLLFSGGREGYFFALDARIGELLWKGSVGGAIASGPMTYSVGGKQYVAVSAGSSLFVFALAE